jgi:hypothetical protein
MGDVIPHGGYSNEERRHDEMMAQLRRNNEERPTDFLARLVIGGLAGWFIAMVLIPLALFALFMVFVFWPLTLFLLVVVVAIWAIVHGKKGGQDNPLDRFPPRWEGKEPE